MNTGPSQPVVDGGLARDATVGVIWTVSQKWVIRITGLLTVAILTRILTPADFGVVAVALSLLPVIQLLADVGFSTFLVQAENPNNRTYSTAFWYSVIAGVALVGLLMLFAPLLGQMLGTSDVVPVIRGLAPTALLVTLGSVPMARLQRTMRFRALAMQGVVAGAIGQAIAIVLAFLGAGVWALVAQTLSFQLVATTLAWIAARWHPALEFSWAELGEMVRFGFKVVGVEFVALSRIWLENAIIVASLGIASLGYLSIAQRLIQIARDLTTTALVPVSMVVFSQIRGTTKRLRSGYLRAQAMSLALVVPVMVFIAIGAPILLPLFFGDQWEPSVIPAQLYAMAGIFALGALDQGLLYGIGKPGVWFCYALVVDTVTVLVTLIVAKYGLSAVALGFLGVAAASSMSRWALVAYQLETQWWRIATPLARVSVPGICAAGVGMAASLALRSAAPVVSLGLIGLAIMAVYLPLLRIFLPGSWTELWEFGKRAVLRITRRNWELR